MSATDDQNIDPAPAGGPVKDAAYWESEAKRAFAQRQAAKKEADDLRQKYGAIDPDEYATLKQQAAQAEEDRQKKAGEWDKLRQQLVDRHTQELSAATQAREAAEARWRDTMIGRAFADAVDLFGPAGATVYLPKHAQKILGEYVDLTPEGGVVVKDQNGDVILDGKTGKPAAFASAMAELIESLPEKDHILRGSGKTGSGSPGGTDTGHARPADFSKPLSRAQLSDPKVRSALKRHNAASGGMVIGQAWERS